MTQNYLNKAQDIIEIDIMQLLGEIGKKYRQIISICIVFAIAGFLFSYFTYVPTYTSSTTFVVSNRTSGILNEADSLTSSDLSASTTLANTFKYILLSDEAMHSIIESYKLDYSIEKLKNCVSITPITSTNILQMSVVTNNAVLSSNIANEIIEYYPDVLTKTLKSASLEVLNPPRVAEKADSYNGYALYPLLGFFAALFVSVIIIYLKLVFNDTLKTTSDISNKLNINVMASIPRVVSGDKKKKNIRGLLITKKSSGFTFTESFKALRTKVETISGKKGYKTFVISSSLENEGKTTAAVNLSIALAGNGKKVLLIDADLRKPSISKYIGLSNDLSNVGIDSVLSGDTPYETAILKIEEFGLSVLLNINEVPNSSELLSSSKMKDLIDCVSAQYDYVIIDSSPASILTDSAVITAYTDAVILALRQDYAPASLVNSVVESLSENRAELIGCIFNIVDDRGIGYGANKNGKYGKYGKYGGYRKHSSDRELSKQLESDILE